MVCTKIVFSMCPPNRVNTNVLLNPINIPLRRFAFAARRGPPSKGEVGLAKAIGAGVVFSDMPLRRFTFAVPLGCSRRLTRLKCQKS